MLWTIFVVFLVLWILGLAKVFAIGAWIWLFLVIWIVSLLAQLARGRGGATTPRV